MSRRGRPEGVLVVRGLQEETERTSGVLGALRVGPHGFAVEQRPETAVGALAAQVAEQRPGLAPGEPVSHPTRQHGRIDQRMERVAGAGLAEEVLRRRPVRSEGPIGERFVEPAVDDARLDEPIRTLARRLAGARPLAGRRAILAGPEDCLASLCPLFLAPHTLWRWPPAP